MNLVDFDDHFDVSESEVNFTSSRGEVKLMMAWECKYPSDLVTVERPRPRPLPPPRPIIPRPNIRFWVCVVDELSGEPFGVRPPKEEGGGNIR